MGDNAFRGRDVDPWVSFARRHDLSKEQVRLFERYYVRLMAENKQANLTAITSLRGVLERHFSDSLALSEVVDFACITSVMDIGSGAGFPGAALKIAYSHLKVGLMEVRRKRQQFLRNLIGDLGLSDISLCEYDFRTFIRTTEGAIDLFVARASLDPVELSRLFKPASSYNKALLVYFAADEYEIPENIKYLVVFDHAYRTSRRSRRLIGMARPDCTVKNCIKAGL